MYSTTYNHRGADNQNRRNAIPISAPVHTITSRIVLAGGSSAATVMGV